MIAMTILYDGIAINIEPGIVYICIFVLCLWYVYVHLNALHSVQKVFPPPQSAISNSLQLLEANKMGTHTNCRVRWRDSNLADSNKMTLKMGETGTSYRLYMGRWALT